MPEKFPSNESEPPLEKSVKKELSKPEIKSKRAPIEPEEVGKKDNKEIEEFVKKNMSDAMLRLFSGEKVDILRESIDVHGKEFMPKKMEEIDKDAKDYVENMPGYLQSVLENPNIFRNFAKSFEDKNEENVRQDTQQIIEWFKDHPDFRQWLEEQYKIKRLEALIKGEPEKTLSEKGFTKEEQDHMFSMVEEEADRIVRDGKVYEFSLGLDVSSSQEKKIEEILSRITDGEKIGDSKIKNEIFEKVYKKLQGKAEQEQRWEDPYREIERRLQSALGELKREGLNEDAENLAKTIERIKKDVNFLHWEENPNIELILWDKTTEGVNESEPTKIEKVADKLGLWVLRIPLLGRYMSRDYRESIRSSGGTIIRADGTKERFYPFSRFKKEGEKTHTNDLVGNDYDYRNELQEGDEIVSWEPTEKAKIIIMSALGGSSLEEGTSMGDSDIKYWSSEHHTNNVQFKVDIEKNSSSAYLRFKLPPFKGQHRLI